MAAKLDAILNKLNEQHIVGRWTDLPVLEMLAPATLFSLPSGLRAQALSQLQHAGVPQATLIHIRHVMRYRDVIDQLAKLFHKLHQVGFPLGPEEYRLVLVALQGGWGRKGGDDLKRLCRLLWLKDHTLESMFDYLYTTTVTLALDDVQREGEPFAEAAVEARDEADIDKTADSMVSEPDEIEPDLRSESAAEMVENLESAIETETETETETMVDKETNPTELDDERAITHHMTPSNEIDVELHAVKSPFAGRRSGRCFLCDRGSGNQLSNLFASD